MPWVVFATLAALAGATVATLTKAGIKKVDPGVGLAVQSVLILVISWGVVAVRGNLKELGGMERKAWVFLLLSGVVTSLSYLLLFWALKLGDASRVVPVDRLSLVFAIILGAVFLKEEINAQVVWGGLLMVGGALLIALAPR